MKLNKLIKVNELDYKERLLELEESREVELFNLDGKKHERPYTKALLKGDIKRLNRELIES